MHIYLDNIATTRVDSLVTEAMMPYIKIMYGNASSIHTMGAKASEGIEKARAIIAAKINASPDEVYFTSGGTESNNWALKGILTANRNKGNHIILSSVEHPSIMETAMWLARNRAEISFLPVDAKGFVDPADIRRLLRKDTILVSVMHANNETGTIQPVEEIGNLCKEHEVYFHTDACQSFTKLNINLGKQNADMITINAHKIHGPKGTGALIIRKGTRIDPLLHGGGQENEARSGTYNTPAIVGFGKAVEIAKQDDSARIRTLRDYFINELFRKIDHVVLNGPGADMSLCNILNVQFQGVRGKYLFLELNKRNVIVSTGSACSSTKLTPSHVLTAMGIDEENAHGAVRISLSKWTTKEEVDATIGYICEIVKKAKNRKD